MENIITVQAPSDEECWQKILKTYGRDFTLLNKRTIRTGGILGLFSHEAVEMYGYLRQDSRSGRYAPVLSARSAQTTGQTTGQTAGQTAAQGGGQAAGQLAFEDEKIKTIAAAGKDPATMQILAEIRSIKESIETASAKNQAVSPDHPTITRLEDIMARNDFSARYTRAIVERVRREFSLEEIGDFDAVQKKVVEWIGESIKIYQEDSFQRRPRIITLVGPTGVGKTTTIAKLAAGYLLGKIGQRPLEVRLITIDRFRIGADKQIKRYGELMSVPVSCVDSYKEFKEAIALNPEGVDVILVDTMGRSPHASVELAEMKEFLSACGSSAEYHLCLAATTKASDIEEILAQFEPFGYRSVIVTKMDETGRPGNVISALSARNKPVSWITEGQQVPQDIQKAGVMRFLNGLEEFRMDREELEQKFSRDGTGRILWS